MVYFNKRSSFYCLVILSVLIYQVSAQENKSIQNGMEKLAIYANTTPPEKVYLQTDKDFYTNGETIWFKSYILNGITHEASDISRVVYVELVDSEKTIIAQRKIYLGFDAGSGDISLSKDIEEGTYLLRAYTKYMLNEKEITFFEKTIPIARQELHANNVSNVTSEEKKGVDSPLKKKKARLSSHKPLVQFFPEGGHLVAGLPSILGIKITDEGGNGIALEGKIMNQKDSLIALFRSYEFGLGQVPFKAEINADYYAEIEIDKKKYRYPLPSPLSKGYVLQISNMGDYLQIRVSTNITNGLTGSLMLGHLRGDPIVKHFQENDSENAYSIKLLTSELDDGVASFTLFTAEGEPVCERLVFIENQEKALNMFLKTNKSHYSFRDKVNIDLTLLDKSGAPLDGDFSMSVITKNAIEPETGNIKSWLLLNSDLGGTIENPGYFFEEDSPNRKNILDMLMLTHGWRRFVWKEFTTDNVLKEQEFESEKGIGITGRTTSFKNEYQPRKSTVQLTVGQKTYKEEKSTNAQGKFSFGPIVFQDSVSATITATHIEETKKGKEKIAIYLDPPFPTLPIDNVENPKTRTKTITIKQPYLEEAYRKKVSDFEHDPTVTQLKEVVVAAEQKSKSSLIDEKLNARTLYGSARNRLFPDSIPWLQNGANGVLDVLRTVPGVQVFGSYPNQSVQIRGAQNFNGPIPPLFLVDGIAVSSGLVQAMQPFEVLFVDVLKGSEAAIYGSRGAGGVVAVYTRRGESFEAAPERQPNVIKAIIPGFYKAREFYRPNYEVSKPEHQKPDYRTTLHWQPDIQLNKAEQKGISFYTGDTNGTYIIRLEGITNDGRPVSKLHTFNVQDNP